MLNPAAGLRRVHKVVVFVLEDFDKFTAKRQAVFYNILDTMHGPDMQVQEPACYSITVS